MHIPDLLMTVRRRLEAVLRQEFPVPHASWTTSTVPTLERPPPEKDEEGPTLELAQQQDDLEAEAELWQRREQLHDLDVELLSVPLETCCPLPSLSLSALPRALSLALSADLIVRFEGCEGWWPVHKGWAAVMTKAPCACVFLFCFRRPAKTRTRLDDRIVVAAYGAALPLLAARLLTNSCCWRRSEWGKPSSHVKGAPLPTVDCCSLFTHGAGSLIR
jgi:hypothetical protein